MSEPDWDDEYDREGSAFPDGFPEDAPDEEEAEPPQNPAGPDGKLRVLSTKCATCVFRPGDPMHLGPGRLQDLVHRNLAARVMGRLGGINDTITPPVKETTAP